VIAGCNHQRSVLSVRSFIAALVLEKTPVAKAPPDHVRIECENFPRASQAFLGEPL
jgi:hypothetical protein